MPSKGFSPGEVLKNSWDHFRARFFTWFAALLIVAAIGISHIVVNKLILGEEFNLMAGIQNYYQNSQNEMTELPTQKQALLFAVGLAYFLLEWGLSLGLINMGLRAAKDLPYNIFHLFSRIHYVFHYLIAMLLYGLIILAGLFLLIFPAAIWGSKFSLYPYFIADKGAGPIQALKLSSSATYGAKWDIFSFLLIQALLFIANIFSLFLGLIILIPLFSIAWGFIYRYLTTPIETEILIKPVETV